MAWSYGVALRTSKITKQRRKQNKMTMALYYVPASSLLERRHVRVHSTGRRRAKRTACHALLKKVRSKNGM
jgi:hypothetical protein